MLWHDKPKNNPCNCLEWLFWISQHPLLLSSGDSSRGANTWETRMQKCPCTMNKWIDLVCLGDNLFFFLDWEICYAQASMCMCVPFLPELSSCFVCGTKSVTQRRLTKTGSDQGVRRGRGRARQEAVSAPGSLTLHWRAEGRCVSLFWHKSSWEFTGK